MAPGYRQLVKRAVAQYFGGAEQVGAEALGIYYGQGPLVGFGLNNAWPYQAKGIPDILYFGSGGVSGGEVPGESFGAILTVELLRNKIIRQALGGPVSGWRDIETPVVCYMEMQSTFTYAEQAETAADDLIEAFIELIYQDRTLGTTGGYPNLPDSRLIVEAGEKPYGIESVLDPGFVDEDRGRVVFEGTVQFNVSTYWQS